MAVESRPYRQGVNAYFNDFYGNRTPFELPKRRYNLMHGVQQIKNASGATHTTSLQSNLAIGAHSYQHDRQEK